MVSKQGGVDDGEDFVEEGLRGFFDEGDAAGAEIEGFDLFAHDESRERGATGDGNMEGDAAVGIRDRAAEGKAGGFVEERFADDHGGSAAFLLVAGLGVEGQRDEVALGGDGDARHQTSLPAGFQSNSADL